MAGINIIVADPPYGFGDGLSMSKVKRGAKSHYKTMSINEMCELDIKNMIDPEGALLALWVPSSLLQNGLDIMKAWGFQQKQTFIWVKTKKEPLGFIQKSIKTKINAEKISAKIEKIVFSLGALSQLNLQNILGFGMGRLFRGCHEICLIGINNTGIYKKLRNRSQRSVVFSTNYKHSQKPEALQDSLDLMYPDDVVKVELFARRKREGWVCLGNEVCDGEDIRDSIEKLKTKGII